MPEHYLTVDEVAEYLKLPVVTIYLYARNGSLPAAKLGKHWRFSLSHLEEWISQNQNIEQVGSRYRVLIVDDEMESIAQMSRWLEEVDCEVTVARNAADVFRVLHDREPNLILADPTSGGFGGIQTLRKLREMASQADLAIVAEKFDNVWMEQALDVGPFTILRKPVQKPHLLNLVQTVDHR